MFLTCHTVVAPSEARPSDGLLPPHKSWSLAKAKLGKWGPTPGASRQQRADVSGDLTHNGTGLGPSDKIMRAQTGSPPAGLPPWMRSHRKWE